MYDYCMNQCPAYSLKRFNHVLTSPNRTESRNARRKYSELPAVELSITELPTGFYHSLIKRHQMASDRCRVVSYTTKIILSIGHLLSDIFAPCMKNYSSAANRPLRGE